MCSCIVFSLSVVVDGNERRMHTIHSLCYVLGSTITLQRSPRNAQVQCGWLCFGCSFIRCFGRSFSYLLYLVPLQATNTNTAAFSSLSSSLTITIAKAMNVVLLLAVLASPRLARSLFLMLCCTSSQPKPPTH